MCMKTTIDTALFRDDTGNELLNYITATLTQEHKVHDEFKNSAQKVGIYVYYS